MNFRKGEEQGLEAHALLSVLSFSFIIFLCGSQVLNSLKQPHSIVLDVNPQYP